MTMFRYDHQQRMMMQQRKRPRFLPCFERLERLRPLDGSDAIPDLTTVQADNNLVADQILQDGDGLDPLPLPVEPIEPFA